MFREQKGVTCRSMTEGIWRRVDGSRLISFIMLDNRMGISLRRKLNDSASVALRPKSTNCWMDNGDGLYWANVSRRRSDVMSKSFVRFRETGANLIAAIGIALTDAKIEKLKFWQLLFSLVDRFWTATRPVHRNGDRARNLKTTKIFEFYRLALSWMWTAFIEINL